MLQGVQIGALPTKASTYAELTDSSFLKKKKEEEKKKKKKRKEKNQPEIKKSSPKWSQIVTL